MMAEQKPLTHESVAAWPTVNDVFQQAAAAFNNESIAKTLILERLRGGQIVAVAGSASYEDSRRAPYGPAFVAPEAWLHIDMSNLDPIWIGGTVRVRFYGTNSRQEQIIRFFDIKFDPDGVAALMANAPKKSPSTAAPTATSPAATSPQPNKGGAPRKEWWDDFWIAICGQIYDNKLNPKTQAELGEAMLQWVENNHGGEVGETTIKAAARKLFKAWELGSKT